MNKPLITVIVPVYKVEQYIERCVRSICMQTYQNLEIILVDDGSPDQSGKICDELAKQDSRIRVIHKENGGQASARNRGLDEANGDFIGFVDADDWIAPEMYESLYTLMKQQTAQIACCGIDRCNDSGHVSYFNPSVDEQFTLNRNDAMIRLIENDRITSSPCDKLYCKSIFFGLRMQEGMIFEDFEIMHHCIFRAERVAYTGMPYYHYYLSPNSTLRQTFTPKQFDSVRASEMRLDFYQQNSPENLEIVEAKHVEICLDVLYRSRKSSACKQLRQQLKKALALFLRNHPSLKLSSKTKIKLLFLRFGIPVYSMAMRVFYWLSGHKM